MSTFFQTLHLIHKTRHKIVLNTKIVLACVVFTLCMACQNTTKLPDPLQAGWQNQAVCEVVENNPKIRVLKCTFPPGVGHDKHYHASHFGYTIQGSTFKITDATGTRVVEVPTGTEFYNDGIDWHQVQNVGDSTAIFLIVEPK